MPTDRMSNYVRQKLTELQREADLSAVAVRKLYDPLLKTDTAVETDKDRAELNPTINRQDITDIHRPLHPTTAKNILLKLT